jgi:electron transport complex protein RnfG
MSKSESTLINMVLTLLIITAIAGASMGFVYKLTKVPIEAAKRQNQQAAINEVISGFDNDPNGEMYELKSAEGFTLKIYPAKKGAELIGVAIETMSNTGFGGDVKIMVGMKPDGTIINYKVLEHKETPGLGTKMVDWFKNGGGNIIGKNPGKNKLTVTKDGGEVDAITAATISSRAFLNAIATAYNTYKGTNDAVSSATTKIDNGQLTIENEEEIKKGGTQ